MVRDICRTEWMVVLAFSLGFLRSCCSQFPHVLVVVMDDMGSHDLGMHGTGIQSPNCDSLARDGIYLSNYYVLPSCSPTRTALLSGRYPLHTGVTSAIGVDSTIGLPLDEETLPQLLGRAGYQRHAVGKWHAGHSSWLQCPTFRGFESFYGFYSGGEDYYTHTTRNGYDMRFDKREFCGKGCSEVIDERGNYSTHVFTRAAIDVIERYEASRGPLFLYLAFQAVHAPDEVPKEYERPYESKNWTQTRKTYAGMLSAADEGIGNVTAALKAKGLWDKTLVVFTTDNGGPTEHCAVQGSSNWPLRGGKCTIWEGGTTGDGFVSGPALASLVGGGRAPLAHLFHVVDWLPTLADIVGVPPAGQKLDGVSQLGALRGAGAAREELFVGVSDGQVGSHGPALRYRQWKIIEGGGGGRGGWVGPEGGEREWNATLWSVHEGSHLLFDLSRDRAEQRDLAAQHPEVVALLMQKMEAYKASGVPPQQRDPSCTWTPADLVDEPVGPTWAPWCSHASSVVFYT